MVARHPNGSPAILSSAATGSSGANVVLIPFEPVIPSQSLTSLSFLLSGVAEKDFVDGEPEKWLPVLETKCSYAPEQFLKVMDNLLLNPNITSSCLFRAEIFYDSLKDKIIFDEPWDLDRSVLVRSMKAEYRPRRLIADPTLLTSFRLTRTVVRNLIPRNPQLDPALVQTVHYLETGLEGESDYGESLVVQIPHVNVLEDVPFYHPKVKKLSLRHRYNVHSGLGTLSIYYQLFAGSDMTERLSRTALNLLRIVNKHSTGFQNGYQKRVHHDQIVSQKSFQDTYSKLKAKHSKWLLDAWVEVTDPLKHVFEDLGIAAFLIELWKDMYGTGLFSKKKFPGFVDIGCGNGVLVYILLSEGYEGWGFDARHRRSWDVFPKSVQSRLKEMVLVPDLFLQSHLSNPTDSTKVPENLSTHNGIFEPGTFIISNHADQLTPWTPLLAYVSQSPFIAIPCCSHGLSGKLTRFYDSPPGSITQSRTSESSDKSEDHASSMSSQRTSTASNPAPMSSPTNPSSAPLAPALPETPPFTTAPALPSPPASISGAAPPKSKIISAYAGFSAHIMNIAHSIGFETIDKEILRIPSTRNLCVVGRSPRMEDDLETRWQDVREIVLKDVGNVESCVKDWMAGLNELQGGGSRGH
jgi:tRNASer (uridine44-2'-O)-methyltransferase